jgi:hypothetical protein
MRRYSPLCDVLAVSRSPSATGRLAAVVAQVALAVAWTVLCVSPRAARARARDEFDLLRFAPGLSPAVLRGRDVAWRFGLVRRFELTLQVNNAFAGQNRQAIGRAEASIAAIPGVRQVIGPAGLLALTVGPAGQSTVAPLLAGGPDDDASEAVRQRLMRRSDAIGWFVSRDGTQIRVLVDSEDLSSIHGAIESAVAASGLVLLSGGIPAVPLWPEPGRDPRPFPWWIPFALGFLSMSIGALGVGIVGRPTVPRALLVAAVAGVAAASPAVLAPAVGLRHLAFAFGLGAAALTVVLMAIARIVVTGRSGRAGQTRRVRVPLPILMVSTPLLVAVVVLSPRVSIGTQLWRPTQLFFVDVRGDMDEPVVLREVRRLTDFLRAQPGVAHAWSIADLFFAVSVSGETFGGIPTSSDRVRSILARAREDSAARLELAPDHRAALVGVRLDDDSGVDRLAVLERLDRYLLQEHRPSLMKVDVSDPRVAASLRGLARGVLAADTCERVLRICERSGRILNESDVQTVERAARGAALLPVVDPPRLRADIEREVTAFLAQVAPGKPDLGPRKPSDRRRLVDELSAEPVDATVSDVLVPLHAWWDGRLPEPDLRDLAVELHGRLRMARRLHSARINFNDVLYGADLPTEGVLSEEVRDATLDAMGPIAALPVGRDVPGAFLVDPVAVGGAACDRALSLAWRPRLGLGILISAGFTALLLLAVGGFAALAWWPPAMAPAAALILVPATAALPIGVWTVAVLAGALAGGAALAVAFAPGRRDQ